MKPQQCACVSSCVCVCYKNAKTIERNEWMNGIHKMRNKRVSYRKISHTYAFCGSERVWSNEDETETFSVFRSQIPNSHSRMYSVRDGPASSAERRACMFLHVAPCQQFSTRMIFFSSWKLKWFRNILFFAGYLLHPTILYQTWSFMLTVDYVLWARARCKQDQLLVIGISSYCLNVTRMPVARSLDRTPRLQWARCSHEKKLITQYFMIFEIFCRWPTSELASPMCMYTDTQ